MTFFFCWKAFMILFRTMDWYQLLSQTSRSTVSMGSTGPSKWPNRCGQRCSSFWLRTMSCLKVSFSSPAWSLLVLRARTRPHQNRLLTAPSDSSGKESPLLSPESWQAPKTLSLSLSLWNATVDITKDYLNCFGWAVFFRWAIRSSGHTELERHEPSSQPMARLVLICKSTSKHLPQEVGRQTRECEGGSGCSACPSKGQLSRSAW